MTLKKKLNNVRIDFQLYSYQNMFNNFFFWKVPGSALGAGILTDTSFASLKDSISDLTLKAIEEMGFKKMTEIQVYYSSIDSNSRQLILSFFGTGQGYSSSAGRP